MARSAVMPWSISSRKKLSLPKMSWNSPAARSAWDGFPPSARKQMLWSVVSAAKPETQTARIAKIVGEAAAGRRASG